MSGTPSCKLEKSLGDRLHLDDADYVPGAVHLFDVEQELSISKKKGIILQPQPSANPNDPLRWSQKKKNWQFTLTGIWAFFAAFTANWTGPVWTTWTITFETTYSQLNIASALVFVGMGCGCLLFQPVAMKRGRRGTYLFCTILALIANIIGSQAKSLPYLFVQFLLCGFSAAPNDSLIPVSCTDVFFIHERAKYISLLVAASTFGSFLAPVIAGYMPSWKWVFYLQVIVFAILIVTLFFLLEDTTYERSFDKTENEILDQIKSNVSMPAASNDGIISDEQRSKYDAKIKSTVTSRDVTNDEETEDDIDSIDHSVAKRSYRQKLTVWEREYSDKRSWFIIFSGPLYLVTFPAVMWGGIIYGVQIMWLTLLAVTQSEIYTGYYGFSDSNTGLTNLAPLIGSVFGMLYGGPFVDWLAIKLARRNNGILEPEYRLWPMVVPTILNAVGLLAYGLASSNREPWPISVVMGQALVGFTLSSSCPISLTYAADSYEALAGEAMVLIAFVKNVFGCGFTFAIQPWLDRSGLVNMTWAMFGISIAVNGSFLMMIVFGKTFRRWTKKRYYKLSESIGT